MSEMKFRVFLVNYEKYDNDESGKDIMDFGEWFDLPIEPSELGKVITERIGASNQGYYIANDDIETGIYCVDDSELFDCDIWDINKEAVELFSHTDLDDYNKFVIDALLDTGDYSLIEALNIYHEFFVYDEDDYEYLGKDIASELGIDIDCEIEDYIRWEDFVDDKTTRVIFYDGKSVVAH